MIKVRKIDEFNHVKSMGNEVISIGFFCAWTAGLQYG